jgi:hypothetical protein
VQDAAPARRIAITGTFNLRDAGGYPVGEFHMTVWGRLYRSDLPTDVAGGETGIGGLGLRTVVDLRSEGEIPNCQVDLTPLRRAEAASMLAALAVVREIAGSARDYPVRHGVSPAAFDRSRHEMVTLRG